MTKKLKNSHNLKSRQHRSIKRHIKSRRSLPKKFLLHPSFAFLLLCVGVLLIGITIRAFAVSLAVSAKVSAPFITTPAVIQIITPTITTATTEPLTAIPSTATTTSASVQDAKTPESAVVVIEKTITLNGECPKNSHLEFHRNGVLAGVAPCIGDPTFTVTLDLVPGLNSIVAKVFNITDDEGPAAQNLYISYTPLVAPTTTPSSTATSTTDTTATNTSNSNSAAKTSTKKQTVKPLNLTGDFADLGFFVNEKGKWDLNVTGGTAPYKIKVSWGDGNTEELVVGKEGDFSVSHTYTKASDRTGYVISIQAEDSNNNPAIFQLISVISEKGSDIGRQVEIANSRLHPSIFSQLKRWLFVAWPAYVILILMLASFWLGEREEYKKLVGRFRRRK